MIGFLSRLFAGRSGKPLTEADLKKDVVYELLNTTFVFWGSEGACYLVFLREKDKREVEIYRIRCDRFVKMFGDWRFNPNSTIDVSPRPQLNFVRNGNLAEVL